MPTKMRRLNGKEKPKTEAQVMELEKAGVQIAPWKQSLVSQIEEKVRRDARQHLHDVAIALRKSYGMDYDHVLSLVIEVAEEILKGGEVT